MLIRSGLIRKYFKLLICLGVICIIGANISLFKFNKNLSNRLFFSKNDTVLVQAKHCTILLYNPYGRLGNVMFEFATAYGLSLDHSCHLYIGPKFIKELRLHFEINLPNLLTESEINLILPAHGIENHCTDLPELLQPNTPQRIILYGNWQMYKHFVNHTNEIRDQFRFKKSILDQAGSFINTTITLTNVNLVGIHIRRGDFVGNRNVSSDEFIFDAMNYFTRKYISVNFIIVSDDKSYCRNVFGKRNDTFFTPDSFTPAEDMAILTLCDHAILTVGTYGWWGAFLLHNRTGEVIADAKPDHSPLDVNCEGSVFFPPWFSFLNKTK